MANTSRINGLTPVRHITNAPWNGALEIFYHSTANASAIYRGSIVKGATGLAGAGSDPLGVYPTVVVADAQNGHIVGVAWSFGETPQLATRASNLNAKNYCPASTAMYIGVITDPSVVFEVQDDGGTAITALQIGSYIDFSSDAAKGSTVTGRSLLTIATSSVDTTNARQARILKLVNRPDNELSSWAKWEVILTKHINTEFVAGVGYATT